MSQIPSTGSSTTGSSTSSSSSTSTPNKFSSVDVDQFLKLLVTELQNQDPTNPTSNAEFLQQVSQISQISSTNQLSDTLGNFSVSQQLSMASNLIGQSVNGLDSTGNDVSGTVDRVSVETNGTGKNNRIIKIHVGDQTVDMNNIREILPAAS